MIFLNHGSYGATPRTILAAQARWRARLEAQPCQFINNEAPAAIRKAASDLAAFLGAKADDIAFVENTTSGINAVLKSLSFKEGDEVLVTDHVYNAVRNTLRFVLEPVGASIAVAEVGLPIKDGDDLAATVLSRVTAATRLILIDHVASVSGVVFPVAQIAANASVPVLVDGAHAPGMLDLDVPSLGVAYYVGNCHKWLCAPKGAAFLWTGKEGQVGLHPTVISHDLGKGFTAEFDKLGTRDASPWLTVPDALAFHAAQGGPLLRKRNHTVVTKAAAALAERWETEVGAPAHHFGSMATVRVPGDLPPTRETADAMKAFLWRTHRAEVHVMPFCGALWVRLSVQAYNTEAECLAIGAMVEEAVRMLPRLAAKV
ncbi:MAG: aminotransferase class V-fold PLP-dependent enzyme [Devosia sp.]